MTSGMATRPGREQIGPLLVALRRSRGWSQLRVAQRLCAESGMPTVSRHEVSRWERGARVPGSFWLRWLAEVFEQPLERLELAVAAAQLGVRPEAANAPGSGAPPPAGPLAMVRPSDYDRLWRRPGAAELRASLEQSDTGDLPALAQAWLVGPPAPPPPARLGLVATCGRTAEALDRLGRRLTELRRMDDLMGGADLIHHVRRELGVALGLLAGAAGARQHRRALRMVAQFAQLAGWLHADAGQPEAARRAYRVALRAAATSGDQVFAGHVLGGLSQLTLEGGEPQQALLLARIGQTGLAGLAGHAGQAGLGGSAGPGSPQATGGGLALALLRHRVALAAAHAGRRGEAHAALSAAAQAGGSASGPRPSWLYWLDAAELAAMTGRCLVALGRPARAARWLAAPRRAGPRAAALYTGCLATAYLQIGEVEHACRLARRAMRQTAASGSHRAAALLRRLHPQLLAHRDLPPVRGYAQIAAAAASCLPGQSAGAAEAHSPGPAAPPRGGDHRGNGNR